MVCNRACGYNQVMKRSSLDPDEIFLDSSNLPSFNKQQFEGHIERPIARRTFAFLAGFFLLVGIIFLAQVMKLQVWQGEALAARSENNTLRHIPIFADRGVLTDRYGVSLAWNDQGQRQYIAQPGFAHVLGYISKPREEEIAEHNFFPDELVGRDGAEKIYNSRLRGEPGIKIEERDVRGETASDYLLEPALAGDNLMLSIDARVQSALATGMHNLISEGRFSGGAGVIMDTETGEIIALSNLPEYDPNILTRGEDREQISNYLNDKLHPFLNRAVAGTYTPGSIVKPFVALAALTEEIISPSKEILSTGQLVVPNPYFPDKPTIFRDWKAHGLTDMREAIAVSSDVYFYTIGGGAGGQAGLGIDRIKRYAHLFGLGELSGGPFPGEAAGVVPSREWKELNFNGESWLLGNTYHTAIGQYGFLVTPLQMVRAVAALSNGGRLLRPTLLAESEQAPSWTEIAGIDPADLEIIKEGMRLAVTEGTASGLNLPTLEIAAKTGTAELGTTKEQVHSWVTGFFPYRNPRYAFAVVMERAQRTNLVGATYVMRQVFDQLAITAPEYLEN